MANENENVETQEQKIETAPAPIEVPDIPGYEEEDFFDLGIQDDEEDDSDEEGTDEEGTDEKQNSGSSAGDKENSSGTDKVDNEPSKQETDKSNNDTPVSVDDDNGGSKADISPEGKKPFDFEAIDPQKDPSYDGLIKNEIIPNTKEYITSCRDIALERVNKFLKEGEDFDEYNPDHMAMYQSNLIQVMREKEKKYENNVSALKEAHTEYKEAKERESRYQSFNEDFRKIINTEQKAQLLDQSLGELKHKDYARLEEAYAKGNFDVLLDYASRVSSLGDRIVPTEEFESKSKQDSFEEQEDEHLFSDELL